MYVQYEYATRTEVVALATSELLLRLATNRSSTIAYTVAPVLKSITPPRVAVNWTTAHWTQPTAPSAIQENDHDP